LSVWRKIGYLIRNCWNYLKFCGVIQLSALLFLVSRYSCAMCSQTTCLYARKVVRSALSRGFWSQWNKHLGTRL
jgi:hypothetical protein